MRKSLIMFVLITGSFLFIGCQAPQWFFYTSSGIVQYNRNTGQFEMIWENQAKNPPVFHDTVYVYR